MNKNELNELNELAMKESDLDKPFPASKRKMTIREWYLEGKENAPNNRFYRFIWSEVGKYGSDTMYLELLNQITEEQRLKLEDCMMQILSFSEEAKEDWRKYRKDKGVEIAEVSNNSMKVNV